MKYIYFFKDWSNQRRYMTWLWAHIKPFLSSLLFLLGVDIILALLSVAMSVVGKVIIDTATEGNNIKQGIVLYIGLVIVGLLFGGIYGLLGVYANEKISFGIRRKIYRKILDSSWIEVSKYHTGDLMTRLTSDINTIASGIAYIIPSIFTLFIKLSAAFFTLLYFDSTFALFALILGPIAAIISVLLGKVVRKLQVKVQETEASYRSFMQESMSNMVIVKSFCSQDLAERKLGQLRNDRLFWVMKKQKMSVVASTAMNIAYYLGYITAFAWGALKLSTNAITFGTMSVFLSLVNQVQGPVVELSKAIPQIISILASAGRVIEIQELEEEDTKKIPLNPQKISIIAENLTFGYTEEHVISNAQLRLKAGEFAAIIGTSGIGKTTLIRLFMAFLTPTEGSIILEDEQGNRMTATAGVREFISYVPQGNTLMSGTIGENLRMGKPNATEQEMWEVLRAAKAEDFVKEMPNGMDTVIGEKAMGLSEGQAQRISIARALIRKAPLLILDEATSSLDEQTELAVLQNIRSLEPVPTCILITHRQSVLPFCDRELEIKEGGIWNHECQYSGT